MPDLGKYAFEVGLAYGGAFVVLGAVIWISFRRASQVARELHQAEQGKS